MNATAVCDTTPNQLLFGGEGCCIENVEPFELAEWTGKFCNGSEWKRPFDPYGGMARLDWLEWIMPWNWTVRSDKLPPEEQKCTAPSKYLAIYGGEHFFWLFFSVGIGAFRLWIARHEEQYNRSILRFLVGFIWKWFKRPFRRNGEVVEKPELEGEHLRPTLTEKLRWGFPVVMGVVLAGAQLGFNFWAAHVVQSEEGYKDTPFVLLALLFCCRPRLSWLSCLGYLTPDSWLIYIFQFEENGDGLWAAKLVVSSVAVTSAVTEAIMQLLGAYFMIRTADVGRRRGFYYVHHLRPMFRGKDARHMYLGALFWAMLFVPLLVVWLIVAIFFSSIVHTVTGLRRNIFKFLRPKAEKLPTFPRTQVLWLSDHIDPDRISTATSSTSQPPLFVHSFGGQVIPVSNDQPIPVNDSPYDQPIPIPYGGPATGDFFNEDQPMPVRQRSNPRRTPYAPLSQSELDDQIMPIARSTAGGYRTPSAGYYAPGNGGLQRRTPSGNQYSSLPHHAGFDEDEDQVLAVSQTMARPFRPEMAQVGGRLGGESHHSLLGNDRPLQPPSTIGSGSTPRRSDYTGGLTRTWPAWEKQIIFAGAFLGMLAYASQWMFWDGFVKTAGDRFCPPKVIDVGAVWWGGSLIYVGAPLMGY
ncbi:hypothetical protein BDV96DRAFT_647903 [Lophiotrema nucula]|uniref:Transmembrane protein n=1 Tax=Lophiotrema nucula TaxID=690887 RepID=A0A6A5Z2G4_9PLEO|nr:hypothetical protein BDV96DRAFT_647903 [Lophiotrema nucula]